MNIAVCIKSVIDIEKPFIIENGVLKSDARKVLNYFDACAVEGAIRLKDAFGYTVKVVCVGTAEDSEIIKKALAMGADEAVHIETDPQHLATEDLVKILASYFQENPVNAIFCGKQSQDQDGGMVGGMLAHTLNFDFGNNIIALNSVEGNIEALRQADNGQERIQFLKGVVLGISNNLCDPRIPALKQILQAKNKPIQRYLPSDFKLQPVQHIVQKTVLPIPERQNHPPITSDMDSQIQLLNRFITQHIG
jgi:electron transfer flavoprotein beta subunit